VLARPDLLRYIVEARRGELCSPAMMPHIWAPLRQKNCRANNTQQFFMINKHLEGWYTAPLVLAFQEFFYLRGLQSLAQLAYGFIVFILGLYYQYIGKGRITGYTAKDLFGYFCSLQNCREIGRRPNRLKMALGQFPPRVVGAVFDRPSLHRYL
jgi:hypothetical protein